MERAPASQDMLSCDILKCVVLLDSLVKELQTNLLGVTKELNVEGAIAAAYHILRSCGSLSDLDRACRGERSLVLKPALRAIPCIAEFNALSIVNNR